MSDDTGNEPQDRLAPFLAMAARVGSTVGSIVANGAAQVMATQRREVRKIAGVLALAFTAAVFACAAAGFAAFSLLVTLGEEHRAAASALIAVCFALLSGVAILLARDRRADR